MNYFLILLLTILIEFIVYLIFIRRKILNLLFYSILINCFTNPLASFIFSVWRNIVIIEFMVFLTEIFLIKYLFSIKYKKAILISFIANLVSFLLGMVIYYNII